MILCHHSFTMINILMMQGQNIDLEFCSNFHRQNVQEARTQVTTRMASNIRLKFVLFFLPHAFKWTHVSENMFLLIFLVYRHCSCVFKIDFPHFYLKRLSGADNAKQISCQRLSYTIDDVQSLSKSLKYLTPGHDFGYSL